MDISDIEPRILKVELPRESTATYRALHHDDDDNGGDTYIVLLTVSVGIDGFIEQQLGFGSGHYPRIHRVDEHNRMRVEIHNTTLEQVRDHLDELTGWLKAAAGRAAQVRREADLEDHRLVVLQQEINQSLRKDG